jgi:hypothetical protein
MKADPPSILLFDSCDAELYQRKVKAQRQLDNTCGRAQQVLLLQCAYPVLYRCKSWIRRAVRIIHSRFCVGAQCDLLVLRFLRHAPLILNRFEVGRINEMGTAGLQDWTAFCSLSAFQV